MFFFFVFSNCEVQPKRGNNPEIEEVPVTRNKNCKAPHTKQSETPGKCECEEGFPYGNPSLSTGCYGCRYECAEHSKCVFPGLCKCLPGYTGSGSSRCYILPPQVIGIKPDNGFAYVPIRVNVSIVHVNGTDFPTAYLNYKEKIYKCNLVAEDVYSCYINRLGGPDAVSLELSYDNQTWSQEYVEFVIGAPDIADFILYSLMGVSIIALAIYIIVSKRRNRRPGPISLLINK